MLKNTIEYKRFVWELKDVIDSNKGIKTKILFVCVGTNRIIGDAFGPVIGSVLKRNLLEENGINVLGDLKKCITYSDLNKMENWLNMQKNESLVIVLDSALSNKKDVGKVFIQNRGLRYAESLKKNNSIIGDISIKGVVGENANNIIKNFENLKNTSIKQIYKMCNIVSNGIIDVMNKKEIYGKNIYK
jgi:putative sporulation protein YyaC